MKMLLSFISVILAMTSTLSAQNTVTISPRTQTINVGESTKFSVSLTVQAGFDASVFLTSSWESSTISPTIINYPYTAPIGVMIKTLTSTKRGIYTVVVSAKIGNIVATDTCTVEVLNVTPWRIFEPNYRTRPAFITLDRAGKLYYSLLTPSPDEMLAYDGTMNTNLSSPYFSSSISSEMNIPTSYNAVIDKDNVPYFFTISGVYKRKDGNLTIYNPSNSALPDKVVKRGAIDSNGKIWMGTTHGLASLENYTITPYNNSNTNSVLGDERITALTVGPDNRVWIGTPTGLVVYNGNTWTRYTPQNSGIPAPYIFGLAVDKNGVVWMGVGALGTWQSSYNDCPKSMIGLVKFDGTTWTLYNSTNSPLTSNYVNGLTLDSKGNVWIGTASNNKFGYNEFVKGCGLLKFDGTNWTSFTTSNSLLPDNDVQWVGADRNDNIWFTCKEKFGVYNEGGLPFFTNDVQEQPESTDGITITPNPSSTTITISGTDAISAVTIVNSFGMEVVGRHTLSSANGSLNVDVSDLASGVYFVQLRTPTGMISKPIVVMH